MTTRTLKGKKEAGSNGGLKMGPKHPNIIVIMVDEWRYPTVYDEANLGDWFADNLPTQKAMKAASTEMVNHYIGSTACTPSRATIFTGQYPTLHGVGYTAGAAKTNHEDDMYFLDPNTVPTMGEYFREGGYRTYYRGKWHVSHSDIEVPVSRDILRTNDEEGRVIPRNRNLYLSAQRLDDYGFRDNIGPDPHGAAQSNAGILRDPLTADQAINSLKALEADRKDDTPFLLVASFLNPHDIVLYGVLWLSFGYDYQEAKEAVPVVPAPPTREEDLSSNNKPDCQSDYVDKYGQIFAPQPQLPTYYRFYFWLMMLADRQAGRVWDAIKKSRRFNQQNTVILFTSDHGDMLGAHGGMHQKWHQAYEETTHVPFLISGPGIGRGVREQILSSHVDILPVRFYV